MKFLIYNEVDSNHLLFSLLLEDSSMAFFLDLTVDDRFEEVPHHEDDEHVP